MGAAAGAAAGAERWDPAASCRVNAAARPAGEGEEEGGDDAWERGAEGAPRCCCCR